MISLKKTLALFLILALSVTYFMACGVKEETGVSSEASSAESIEDQNSVQASEESDKEQGGSENSTSADFSSEPNSSNGAPSVDGTVTESTKEPDNSESSSIQNNSADIPDSSDHSKENASSEPEDSSVSPPADSSVAPPADSSVAPPADSSVAPPADSSVAPPADSSVAPPADSSVAPPEDSSVAPPVDSSEESRYVPTSKNDPVTPIPESLSADPIDSHFNNSLFLGYSIMMHFGRYVGQWRTEIDSTIMGNSINVGAVGISFYSNSQQSPSMSSNSLPRYRGVAYNFEDLPAATGCTTMYIGLTCYSEMKIYSDPQSASEEVIDGVNKIKAKNPNVTIVLLSGTYNTGTFEQLGSKYSRRLSNENIRKFNNYVLDYCNQNGVDFVDVSTPLTNGYGLMPIEYSSDNDYHIVKEAFLIWIDVLRDYARKKEAGTWQNYAVMPTLGFEV